MSYGALRSKTWVLAPKAQCTRDHGPRYAAWNKLLEPYRRKPQKK